MLDTPEANETTEAGGSGLRRAVAAHLDSRQVSRVVYGSVVGLALVVALEVHPPTAGQVAALLASTALAVALAELYSEVLGTRIRLRRSVAAHHRREMLRDVTAVAAGVAFPAVFFLLAALGAFELDTAFAIAKWSGIALLAAYGFVAARLGGAPVTHSAVWALAVCAIGAVVIGLKSLVH
jgi:VIT1/CCC1 family predicted Fe2+/Mn2+ transporter